MDAKAKVVAYRPVVRKDGNATCGYTAHMTSKPDNRDSDWRGEESRQWVRLTDHEAALAELREELQKQKSLNAGYQSTIALIEAKHATLLTGLEALAGEWRKRATGCGDAGNYKMEIAYDLAAKELEQFLASAGLEGK